MIVITDAPEYARSLLGPVAPAEFSGRAADCSGPDSGPASTAPEVRLLGSAFLDGSARALSYPFEDELWRYLVVTPFAHGSQYERLIGLARGRTAIPGGLACVARSGHGFQGFRGRGWVAEPGNIHLSVHLAPGGCVERFETVFMALAAVSVVDTIDELPGLDGSAGIKWVNDVVIEDAKVAGVLAYTQTRGDRVISAVLGIGLNVETRPTVRATAFVPRAWSLRDRSPTPAAVEQGDVLRRLLRNLAENYRSLLRDGYRPLMDRYRDRSIVQGRYVSISTDDADEIPRVFAAGRVLEITDGMELRLAGIDRPVNRGRLILPAPEPERIRGARIAPEPFDIAS